MKNINFGKFENSPTVKKLVAMFLVAVLLCVSVLTGCSDNNVTTGSISTNQYSKYQRVKHLGRIPDVFKNIVNDNIFRDAVAFEGRLLKTEISSADEETKSVTQKIQMMDIYGNKLAAYIVSSDDAYHVTTLTATDDGGFLFVLGFRDYAYEQNVWASDNGFASRVIKCDKDGHPQFDTTFEGVEESALQFCFEKNGRFYLFGTIETPESKATGVHSPTDIFMVILDKSGTILKSQCIAGSDYDSLDAAEALGDGFVLSINSQSDDGDFINSNSRGYPVNWIVTVNDDLDIIEKKKGTGRDFFDVKLGEKDGAPIYKSDALLKNFDAGTPEAFIDYGDFYLIVSENITGEYERTPHIFNSIWHYTETVYSAYNYNGKMIFRTSVDSSPDFDALAENFKNSVMPIS